MYKDVLGEIIEAAQEPNIKKVIGTFDPYLPHKTNLKKLQSFSALVLEKSVTVLELTTRDGEDKKIYSKKEKLAAVTMR